MNNEKIVDQFGKRASTLFLGIIVAILLVSVALAQDGGWTTPVTISVPSEFSWFPDLAVDPFGSVHVVWCLTIPLGGRRGLQEQVNYTRWDRGGEGWLPPNDIVPPSADIVRNAITVDRMGNVHLLFGGTVYGSNLALYHQQAFSSEAWSAGAWSVPHRVNQGISYMGDIAVDSQGTIHIVYDDTLRYDDDEEELTVADVFYRRSQDNGRTWTAAVNLDPDPTTGSARPHLEIDRRDVIHVTWDEGWDRLSGGGDPVYGAYTSSADGGETWSPTTVITYPDSTVAQMTVGSDDQGGVMLVWRTASRDEFFYQWSLDAGRSWEEPTVIPQIFARLWTIPFDIYDMVTDSAGHIHLLVAGRRSLERDAPLGIYHLIWDGEGWSDPTRVFGRANLYPEYPKIVVHDGNQLHATWFTREDDVWDQEANREVWYSSLQSSAPYQPVTAQPTSTPVPPTPTPMPIPTAMPYPTVSFKNTGLPDGLRTENDDVLRLAIALSPVALIILIVMAVRMGWFRRSR
jgi:hypothetical protein